MQRQIITNSGWTHTAATVQGMKSKRSNNRCAKGVMFLFLGVVVCIGIAQAGGDLSQLSYLDSLSAVEDGLKGKSVSGSLQLDEVVEKEATGRDSDSVAAVDVNLKNKSLSLGGSLQLDAGVEIKNTGQESNSLAVVDDNPKAESLSQAGSLQLDTRAKRTGYCDGKDGILMIEGGDGEAAVGTLFFMYTVNHLIYADLNNLVPWVHMRPAFPCYDASVHGNETRTFTMLKGSWETKTFGGDALTCNYWKRKQYYPGPVEYAEKPKLEPFTITGNGLWESYFEPLSGYPPDDPSCRNKTLLTLNKRSVFPGMHVCATWGVRPWPIPHTPAGLTPEGNQQTYHKWLGPMRERGADKVGKYFQPLPWMTQLIEKANPSKKCLSMHIRLTDKGNGRQKQPLRLFQYYAEAYVSASGGGAIFVATDDGTILDKIRSNWTIKELYHQNDVIRSSGSSAIFRTFQNETHRTNTEGLVDMYALSRCEFFVHGYSAMAEAAVYINPQLHNRSVNVDAKQKERIPAKKFHAMVAEYYKTSK